MRSAALQKAAHDCSTGCIVTLARSASQVRPRPLEGAGGSDRYFDQPGGSPVPPLARRAGELSIRWARPVPKALDFGRGWTLAFGSVAHSRQSCRWSILAPGRWSSALRKPGKLRGRWAPDALAERRAGWQPQTGW